VPLKRLLRAAAFAKNAVEQNEFQRSWRHQYRAL
jgi:hypothetical protein